ncbi:MAG: NADP-dependent oxidoreductase [Mycolicibacterium sp.]|nr:NADP-dependent oxidoreductase [Mycolicibacterium sp.]
MSAADRNPADLVRYDHVIRLTQYRSSAGIASQAQIDEFIAAWEELNDAPVPGVLYRELCRQVPEWSAMAAKEMDNPIDATFLEYLIAEPGVDFDALSTVPSSQANRYSVVSDLHMVAFRFVKDVPGAHAGVLMFNLFEIDGPAGMEQGFVMGWPARAEFRMQDEANRSSVLHQRILPRASVKAFNRAEISSAAAYAAGIDRFEAAFPRAQRGAGPGQSGAKPPIRSHLGLFEIVALAPPGAPAVNPEMKAVVLEEYGDPQVLRLHTVRRPEPGPGQIRVRVRASVINQLDALMRSGQVRHIYPPWFPDVLGFSVAGIVDAVGRGVTTRTVGEAVYGISDPIKRHGYAEYLVAPASNFYPKPSSMDFPAAAAAPPIFATAYGALFLRTGLRAGQTVLIHGGSGAVGSCAVQLAKHAGAHVIATASTRNVERVRRLGADVVVDYRTQRFEDFAHDVDVVLDTVGAETRERSWPLIRRAGALATLVPAPPDEAIAQQYGVQAFMVHGHPNIGEIMPEMTRRLESGDLILAEIAAVFPLEQAAVAHSVFENDQPRGRIVLAVPG